MKTDTATENFEIFFTAWDKFKNHKKLTPLENHIRKIIEMHPQTHGLIGNKFNSSVKLSDVESEPFTHLAFHAILMEMISSDQPEGIRSAYDRLVMKLGDKHEAQHRLMTGIFDWMIEIQATDQNPVPDDQLLVRIKSVLDDADN